MATRKPSLSCLLLCILILSTSFGIVGADTLKADNDIDVSEKIISDEEEIFKLVGA